MSCHMATNHGWFAETAARMLLQFAHVPACQQALMGVSFLFRKDYAGWW